MDVLLTDTCQSTGHEGPQGALSLIAAAFLQYLTIEEETRICQQFHGNIWRRNNQVLWSGIPRDHAQQGRLMSAQGTVKEGRKLISSLSGFPAGIGWNFVIVVARFYTGPPVKKYDNTI